MLGNIKYDYELFITRSKNKSYKESVNKRGKILMEFLKENKLLLIEPFNENGELKDDLIIKKDDLTEEGNKFYDTTVPGWWQFLDKGGDPSNISRLEKGLKKIREEKK